MSTGSHTGSEAGLPEMGARSAGACESIFRLSFEQASVGLAHVSLDGHYLRVNGRLCEILGYAPDELCGLHYREVTCPEDLPASDEFMAALHSNPYRLLTLEKRYMRKDRSTVWCSLSVAVLRGADGAADVFLSVIDDISERKRLREEREGFFNLPLALTCIAGWDGYFTDLNAAWEATLGYSLAELKARPYRHFVHPDDQGGTAHEAEHLTQGGQTTNFENRYRCADGRYRWLSWSATSDAERQRVYAIAHDITDRRAAEEELDRYRCSLEQLVAERTKALLAAQESLRRAERLAALGTLASGVAHEINNPVGAVLLAAQTCDREMDRGARPEELRRWLAEIVQHSERCARIVRGLLRFARQEQLEKSVEDVNAVVLAALQSVAGEARRRAIVLEADLAESAPQVLMNALSIEQVVINLVHNALTASRDGATVRIITMPTGEDVRIAIRDSGCGIPEDHLKRIFDPFFTTRQQQGGTGLGLSICHGIISEHGGRIEVQSEPGIGTMVSVVLPRGH